MSDSTADVVPDHPVVAWLKRHRQRLTALLALACLAFVARALVRQDWSAVVAGLRGVESGRILSTSAWVLVSFLALSGYDFVALRLAGYRVRPGLVMRASFVGFVFAMNLGFTVLSGGAVRAFYYARAGVSARGVASVLAHMAVTFLLGWLGLFGLTLLTAPIDWISLEHGWAGPLQRGTGAILLLGLAGYLVACGMSPRIRLGKFSFALPPLRLALVQVAVGVLDACVAGLVLYHILGAPGVSFVLFMGAFLTAVFLGMASHVPGGLGVIEVTLMHLLAPALAPADVLTGMVLYRLLNFLAPLVLAGGLFTWDLTRAARNRG